MVPLLEARSRPSVPAATHAHAHEYPSQPPTSSVSTSSIHYTVRLHTSTHPPRHSPPAMSQDPTIIPPPAALQHHHVGHNHVPDSSTVTAMASAALHSRMSLPSLAVHPPGTYSHPQSPLLSSPDSPGTEDRVLHSSNSTPVVPLSAGSYRRTTAPIILEHSPAGSKRTASGTLKNFGTRAPSPGAAAAPPPSTPRAQRQKIDDRPAASPRNVSQVSHASSRVRRDKIVVSNAIASCRVS